MVSKNELPWIEAGYELFAAQGPDGLRVETLARKVGISKSSFYHHFADIDVFTERLLEWHLDRAVEIAGRARDCRTFDPDFCIYWPNIPVTCFSTGSCAYTGRTFPTSFASPAPMHSSKMRSSPAGQQNSAWPANRNWRAASSPSSTTCFTNA